MPSQKESERGELSFSPRYLASLRRSLDQAGWGPGRGGRSTSSSTAAAAPPPPPPPTPDRRATRNASESRPVVIRRQSSSSSGLNITVELPDGLQVTYSQPNPDQDEGPEPANSPAPARRAAAPRTPFVPSRRPLSAPQTPPSRESEPESDSESDSDSEADSSFDSDPKVVPDNKKGKEKESTNNKGKKKGSNDGKGKEPVPAPVPAPAPRASLLGNQTVADTSSSSDPSPTRRIGRRDPVGPAPRPRRRFGMPLPRIRRPSTPSASNAAQPGPFDMPPAQTIFYPPGPPRMGPLQPPMMYPPMPPPMMPQAQQQPGMPGQQMMYPMGLDGTYHPMQYLYGHGSDFPYLQYYVGQPPPPVGPPPSVPPGAPAAPIVPVPVPATQNTAQQRVPAPAQQAACAAPRADAPNANQASVPPVATNEPSAPPPVAATTDPEPQAAPATATRPGSSARPRPREPARSTPSSSSPEAVNALHFCTGCGIARSRAYHRSHPLKAGEQSTPNLCGKCRAAKPRLTESTLRALDRANNLEDVMANLNLREQSSLVSDGRFDRFNASSVSLQSRISRRSPGPSPAHSTRSRSRHSRGPSNSSSTLGDLPRRTGGSVMETIHEGQRRVSEPQEPNISSERNSDVSVQESGQSSRSRRGSTMSRQSQAHGSRRTGGYMPPTVETVLDSQLEADGAVRRNLPQTPPLQATTDPGHRTMTPRRSSIRGQGSALDDPGSERRSVRFDPNDSAHTAPEFSSSSPVLSHDELTSPTPERPQRRLSRLSEEVHVPDSPQTFPLIEDDDDDDDDDEEEERWVDYENITLAHIGSSFDLPRRTEPTADVELHGPSGDEISDLNLDGIGESMDEEVTAMLGRSQPVFDFDLLGTMPRNPEDPFFDGHPETVNPADAYFRRDTTLTNRLPQRRQENAPPAGWNNNDAEPFRATTPSATAPSEGPESRTPRQFGTEIGKKNKMKQTNSPQQHNRASEGNGSSGLDNMTTGFVIVDCDDEEDEAEDETHQAGGGSSTRHIVGEVLSSEDSSSYMATAAVTTPTPDNRRVGGGSSTGSGSKPTPTPPRSILKKRTVRFEQQPPEARPRSNLPR